MKKLLLVLGLMGLSATVWAKPLSQTEFKSQVKQHYDALELKQAALNLSLDRREHPSLMIAKACDYAKGLKEVKRLSEQNLHLAEAKDELQFISSLDTSFNQSLIDLGTTYETGCLKQ
ncbi:hypothetical protein [Acinetobacter sp. ASP199]|uniref:hypothetical protein n=1 Tax=unclassified Acinetobacter TaxID=196816 RepID=UPI001F6089F2|nr:hypothetical protein [Acinetobacter sp. ASP199]UNT58068.1 hypothetical protein IHE35_07900 [Acinetobacter sp. ASP199]